VAWNNQWFPPNWIWESKKAAYRFYDGHFDVFGKHREALILPLLTKGVSYHTEQNWGMDILHVDKSSGCGGLILYVNGIAYPVRNDNNPGAPAFSSRLVEETNNQVTIELTEKGIGPAQAPYTLKCRPSALAGRADSPVEVVVEGGKAGDRIELGIGLTRMGDETFFADREAGMMGSWGFQEPGIGWIGLGIIYPADLFIRMDGQPEEHRVVLRCEPGKPIVYYIRGDWLRGHQFPYCPSARDWQDDLKETAKIVATTPLR
jgi:hypothetical protein